MLENTSNRPEIITAICFYVRVFLIFLKERENDDSNWNKLLIFSTTIPYKKWINLKSIEINVDNLNMFKLYFSHSGRINRKTFVWSWLSLVFLQILINILIQHQFLMMLLYLPTAHGMVVIAVKRFHDLNRSGWNYLYLLIPGVNLYFLYLLYFKKGNQGDNSYGPDPLNNSKKETMSAHPTDTPTANQYPTDGDGIVFDSNHKNPVYSNPSSGFVKKLILVFGVLCLIIAGAVIYIQRSDSSGNDIQKKISKQFLNPNRDLSNLPKKKNEAEEIEISQFIFQVLNINNDEVTVQFETDIPMNIKFFGVSKDLVRQAEILSRKDQKQAVIYLNSANLLQIGKKYYGYLKNSSEEPTPPTEEGWL